MSAVVLAFPSFHNDESVREYFDRRIPNHIFGDPDGGEAIKWCHINSTCGSDCRRAIDAGAALVERVRMAHGYTTKGNLQVLAIADMVVDICCVYIHG